MELLFYALAIITAGYVWLCYAAFDIFSSDNNAKSLLGGVLLLLLIVGGIVLFCLTIRFLSILT